MLSGISIYTLDYADIRGIKACQLVHTKQFYITQIALTRSPDANSVNYTAKSAVNPYRGGFYLVAATDDGNLLVWDTSSIKNDSENLYKKMLASGKISGGLANKHTRDNSIVRGLLPSTSMQINTNGPVHSKVSSHPTPQEHSRIPHSHKHINSSSSAAADTESQSSIDLALDDEADAKIHNHHTNNHSHGLPAHGSHSHSHNPLSNSKKQHSTNNAVFLTVVDAQPTQTTSPVAPTPLHSLMTSNSHKLLQTGHGINPTHANIGHAHSDNHLLSDMHSSSVHVSTTWVEMDSSSIFDNPPDGEGGNRQTLRSFQSHSDSIAVLVPMNTHSCVCSCSLDGYQRVWNLDLDFLGELVLPNITEAMKKKAMSSEPGSNWNFILERIAVNKQHEVLNIM